MLSDYIDTEIENLLSCIDLSMDKLTVQKRLAMREAMLSTMKKSFDNGESAVLAKESLQVYGEQLPFIPWSKEREFFDSMTSPKQEHVIALLRTMFDLYENGVDCYEDPDDMSNYLGKAFRLDDETFDACVNILNFPSASPQAAAIPEGWQLVPIDPTPEMLKEICLIEQFSDNALTVRYQAMLSAAPKTGGQ